MNACFYLYIIIPLLNLAVNYQSTFSKSYSPDSLTKFSLLRLSASLGDTDSNPDGNDAEGPPSFKPPPPPGRRDIGASSNTGPSVLSGRPPAPLPRRRLGAGGPPNGIGKPPVPTPRKRDLEGVDGGRRPACPLGRRGGVREHGRGTNQDSGSSTDGPVSSGGGSSSGNGSGGIITVKKPSGGPPVPPPRSSSLSS